MFLIKKTTVLILLIVVIFIFIFIFIFINEKTHLNMENNIQVSEKQDDPSLQQPFMIINETKESSREHPTLNVNNTEENELKTVSEKKNLSFFTTKSTPKPIVLMLFGVERIKDEKYGRSDSMMLALVQPKTKELMLLSIPRDTYIEIPGYGFNKLNTAFQLGGPQLAKQTVENWLAIEITDTVSIDYAHFEKMIDLIGGIEIDVDREMVHSEFTLEKGVQTLSGKEALSYVRFRKSIDGNHDSDYKRTERQRQVLSKLSDELLKTRSFKQSFILLRSLINTVDTTLSIHKIITYGHYYSDFSSENITSLSFKGEGDRRNGLWYEIISAEELEAKGQLINEFLEK